MSKTDTCELQTPKIYLYMGHGQDLCDENGLLKKEIVPEGCIYVTIEECSNVSSFVLKDMLQGWIDNYDKNEKILSCPEDPDFRKKLAKLLQAKDQTKIHIHTPGSTYIDNNFMPMQIHVQGEHQFFMPSGLLERQDIRAKLGYENYECLELVKNEKFKKDIIPLYYMASTWPTESYMKNLLEDYNGSSEYITFNDLNRLGYKMMRKASDLMKEYPGIHYNVLCRALSENCDTKPFVTQLFTELQKQQSGLDQKQRNKNRKTKKARKKGIALFNKFKKIVSKSRKNSRK